ncbi:MAG: hypothetical protein KAH32_08125 [Chlamydiia bacterium]|nr:hypothetical protein [Chlamydiia bacterium]
MTDVNALGQQTENSQSYGPIESLQNSNNSPYNPATEVSQDSPRLSKWEGFKKFIGRSGHVISRDIESNPILGGLIKTASSGAIGGLSGFGLGTSLAQGAYNYLLPSASQQASVSREKSLYNPQTEALYSGAFSGEGSNITNMLKMRLQKMHADAPNHLKKHIQKYMESLGITI